MERESIPCYTFQGCVIHCPLTLTLEQTVATECKGDGDLLQSLTVKDITTGETRDLPVNGLFYAIGTFASLYVPNC